LVNKLIVAAALFLFGMGVTPGFAPQAVTPPPPAEQVVSISPALGIPVLLYHHLLPAEENPYPENGAILPVESFVQQMQLLHKHSYHTLSLAELELYLQGEYDPPERSVVITFDDGYQSNYIYAYPILKRYGFRATVFVITDLVPVHTQPFQPTVLTYMSWEEMEQARDVFEFGSHTCALHALDAQGESLLLSQPEAVVQEDLLASAAILDTPYFAYPFGRHNKTVRAMLPELGYRLAFATHPELARPGADPYQLGRYTILPDLDREGFCQIIGLTDEEGQ